MIWKVKLTWPTRPELPDCHRSGLGTLNDDSREDLWLTGDLWMVSLVVVQSQRVVSDPLWPHGLQDPSLPCPSLSPRVCSNSCPLIPSNHLILCLPLLLLLSIFPSIKVFSNESPLCIGGSHSHHSSHFLTFCLIHLLTQWQWKLGTENSAGWHWTVPYRGGDTGVMGFRSYLGLALYQGVPLSTHAWPLPVGLTCGEHLKILHP